MGFTSLAALAGGAAAGLLMPKPQIPAMPALPAAPTVVIPDQPITPPSSPANAPLSPTSMSDTAALRRARAARSITAGGPSELILAARSTRQDQSTPAAGSTSGAGAGGLVTRTTLLGR